MSNAPTPSSKRRRTTHGHLVVWFVSKRETAKPARAPLAALPTTGARARHARKRGVGVRNNKHNTNGSWAGRGGGWAGSGYWRGKRPWRPASRRFSERAPSLRLLKPFAPSSFFLCEHGSHLSGDEVVVDENAPTWLDVYGTNDSLFLASPSRSRSLGSPTAVEGSTGLSKPASPTT